MLPRYFGFVEDPFGSTPDPRYLYSSRTHREALASLHYAFYSNRGFTALIAPPGMGKTTLLFEFLQRVRDSARTAFLFNSQCDSTDLLRGILTEIGLTPKDSLGSMLQQLNAELVETARAGRRFVVVVDEAQNLSEPTLETLRLLTNFETSRAKLMQIVLSGQPQLSDMLLRPGLVQLRQRISTFCRLDPFAAHETMAYIEHRIAVAGYKGPDLFSADALARIAEASEGIPRNINTLCFNGLSLCCAIKKKRVDLAMLDEVLHDRQLLTEIPAKVEKESPALKLSIEHSKSRNPAHQWSGMRISAIAALVLLAVFGLFWAADTVNAGYRRTVQTAIPRQPVPEAVPAPAPATIQPVPTRLADRAGKPDAIEVTVDAEQTLSGIAVRVLGTYDNQLLREIEELNPGLENPDHIHPGETILLPRRHSSTGQK